MARPDSDIHNPVGTPNIGTMTQIIYRKIKLQARPIKFFFSVRYRPIRIPQDVANIETFVRNVGAYAQYDGDSQEAHLLDIPIYAPSYVVLELDAQDGLNFNPEKPGLTLGKYFGGDEALADKLYSTLKYVGVTNEIEDEPIEGCKMIFFQAVHVKKEVPNILRYNQPLNFQVVDDGGTPLTIDPDVRYPGNGGQLPLVAAGDDDGVDHEEDGIIA